MLEQKAQQLLRANSTARPMDFDDLNPTANLPVFFIWFFPLNAAVKTEFLQFGNTQSENQLLTGGKPRARDAIHFERKSLFAHVDQIDRHPLAFTQNSRGHILNNQFTTLGPLINSDRFSESTLGLGLETINLASSHFGKVFS